MKFPGEYLAFLAVLGTVMMSGCVNPGAHAPSKTPVPRQEAVVLENFTVSPPQVVPDSEFTVSFTVRDLRREGEPMEVEINAYDFGACTGEFRKTEKIFPGESKTFTVHVKTPPSQEVGRGVTCPVRIELSYSFDAYTVAKSITVLSPELYEPEKLRFSYPGQETSAGPVKIYFKFSSPQPYKALSPVKFSVYAKNLGSGRVEAGKLEVREIGSESKICSGTPEFYGNASRSVKCTWTPRIETEERTVYLVAEMGYKYILEKTVNVRIKSA